MDFVLQVPQQMGVVHPYKPQNDLNNSQMSLTRASSDVSDRAPLLTRIGDKGKQGPAEGTNLCLKSNS